MKQIITNLVNKFTNNSSKKGEYAENMLYNSLLPLLPTSEVLLTRDISNAGDIHIK